MNLIFTNVLLVLAAIVSISGDIFSKTWTINKRWTFFVAALLLYNISSIVWLFFLRNHRLSIAIPWWQGMVAVPAILAGSFYFREQLSWVEIGAIVLILSGVIILNIRHA